MLRVIDNFTGRLTRAVIGELDSGLAKYATSFGSDPFSNRGNLSWLEAPVQIDSAGATITDLIVAAKTRLESGITYVYAIGHLGRLYKIQVNQPSAYNPNLDNPVLLATLSAQTPTFKYGASIQFYGTTQRIYIGHDVGVTRINFDGTSETFIGSAGSYTANVPRPSVIFLGVSYWGNGTNLVSIDSTATATSYGALSTAIPPELQIRDLDVSPDGNYIQITASGVAAPDMTSTVQDTASLSSANSYRFLWNGVTGTTYTSYSTYNSYLINSNISFASENYTMGYDLGGAAIYSGTRKIVSLPNSIAPNFNAQFSTGNLMGFASPETASSKLQAALFTYGQYDDETPRGLFRLLRLAAASTQTDVIQIPMCLIVSNLFYGSSSAGYTGNQVGSAKVYFSTLETDSGPTTKYRFYKFTTIPTGTGTAIGGVYETQNEVSFRLFRNIIAKKFFVKNVRFYVQPLVTNNSFRIDLIGTGGTVIAGGTKTFTAGTAPTSVGDNLVKFTPAMDYTYTVGVRITNLGTANWIGEKLELEIEEGSGVGGGK